MLTPIAYKALLKDAKFQGLRRKNIDKHSERLTDIFTKLVGNGRFKIDVEECRHIIDLAAELADLMRSSSTQYYFSVPPDTYADPQGPKPIDARSLSVFEAIDVDSMKTVKNVKEALAGREGHVGHMLEVVQFGLRRYPRDEKRSLVLAKPRALVQFFEPLPKHKKRRLA